MNEQRSPKGRGEQVAQERRRRNTAALGGQRQRLTVDMTKLDREKYEYRWANDTPGRLEMLTKSDDWEVVTDRENEIKPDATGMGADVSVHAGTGATGGSVRSVLLRKLKTHQDEDRAAQQRKIDEQEQGLMQGNVPGGSTPGSEYYQPKGDKISIEHGGSR